MIYVIATVNIRPETLKSFLAGARELIAATRKEEGCIDYDLNQSVTDPNVFRFVERWASREALSAHFGMPHLQAYAAVAKECNSQPTVVEIISPAGVEKL